jgi:O-antigen/teichoic acid export membrane protein
MWRRKGNAVRTLLDRWAKANRVLLVNAGSLVGTTVVTSVLGLPFWWVSARLFTPEAVGLSSAAISAMTLLGTACILGLGTLLVGELHHHPGKEAELMSAALLLVAGLGAFSGVLCAMIAPSLSADLEPLRAGMETIMLFAGGVSLTAITIVLDQALIGLWRGELQFFRNAFFSVAKFALVLGAGLWLSHKLGLTIYATWAVGNALSLVPLVGYALLKGGWSRRVYHPEWRLLWKLGPAALQHHVLNIILRVPALTLPVLVTILLSVTMNAWFYVAFMIANFVFSVPYALTTVLFATNSARQADLAQKVRLTVGLSTVTGILMMGALLFDTERVLGLFGPDYALHASWSLRILVLGVFPLIIKNHYLTIGRIQNRMSYIILPMLAGVLLELAGAALGAHLGGLLGLSLGWVIALFLEASCMSRSVYKALRPMAISAGKDAPGAKELLYASQKEGTL